MRRASRAPPNRPARGFRSSLFSISSGISVLFLQNAQFLSPAASPVSTVNFRPFSGSRPAPGSHTWPNSSPSTTLQTESPAFGANSSHTPPCFPSPSRRFCPQPNNPRYPVGSGNVAIFRSIPVNSRRVRWLSASSNQWYRACLIKQGPEARIARTAARALAN